jgi:hypothetical protein
MLLETEKKIQLVNPTYKAEIPPPYEDIQSHSKEKEKKSGPCFVATAVYGSYDAPQVIILRNFRDDYLDTTCLGRLFIKIYYRLSPPIANWINNKNRLKRYSKLLLDKIVNRYIVNLKSTKH